MEIIKKMCVVDGHLLFCGGLNVLDDFHDPNHGVLTAPRLDFAVAVTGSLVVPAMDIPTVGRMALIADPQGAHIWLFTPFPGDCQQP